MAEQTLGLRPLKARIEFVRNGNNSGSISFNTLLITGSQSSSANSSSDLDREGPQGQQSTTFGSLIGVYSILELSRRSLRGAKTEVFESKKGKKFNLSSWLFSLCSTSRKSKAENNKNNPLSLIPLVKFLAVEIRAANENRRS
ncbi:uncharacterized protein LOC133302813 [Gastrolobium bilobum]|uniref:uncharacterized protein LOC133302813 n=1 Tax=Gastrolobium bilobum TaxID=150636 RepID=UPI002AB002FB|nr:uncharacterized protein LOC133302813 [Gastrolobium bilobum]